MKFPKGKLLPWLLVTLVLLGMFSQALAGYQFPFDEKEADNFIRSDVTRKVFDLDIKPSLKTGMLVTDAAVNKSAFFWTEPDGAVRGVDMPFLKILDGAIDASAPLIAAEASKKEEDATQALSADPLLALNLPGKEKQSLLLTAENGVATGRFHGDVVISSSVTKFTLYDLNVEGDVTFYPGTKLSVIGKCAVTTLNGLNAATDDSVHVHLCGKLSPFTDNSQAVCCYCLRDASQNAQGVALPCGDHYLCCMHANDAKLASQHELATCGEHYLCSKEVKASPDLHTNRGKECGLYLCHNAGASFHTRCKHCGGALCIGTHGKNLCYGFEIGKEVEPSHTSAPVAE